MTTEEVQQPETEWIYEEPTTTPEFIASACNGITSISDMDTALMSNADRQRVQRIKRKSLAILDYCIGLLYDELFDEETEKEWAGGYAISTPSPFGMSTFSRKGKG